MHECTLIFLETPRSLTPVLQCGQQGFSPIWNLKVPLLAQLRCCFDTNPKDEVLCACLPQDTQWLIFHSSCLQSKALCLSARSSCLGIPDKWQLQHRSNVVFGHRQSYSNDTSHKDVLESTQGEKGKDSRMFLAQACNFFECTPCLGL